MKITTAEFTISAVSPKQYPASQDPEIALVGRSNVGKSSLINKFLNRKGLARTSSQPGKTQTLNFYHINKAWYFVDLPGYGFARVSKELKARWGKFIEEYLRERRQLVGVIQIIDIRHPPTKDDLAMYEWLVHYQLPTLIVATKADKISRGQWLSHVKTIKTELKLDSQVPLIVFSSETGTGLEELHRWVEERIDLEQEGIQA
ncbi:MAG: GTP-binding protein [Peptococcaceae bacterium]|jgi:GTP-binding protein|nr:GTP-binding protein [Peptococcaceae bacterium]